MRSRHRPICLFREKAAVCPPRRLARLAATPRPPPLLAVIQQAMGSVPTTASWGILQIWDEQEAEPRDVALVGDRKFVIGCIDEAHHATHLASPSRVNCDHRPSPQADVKIPARCVSSAHWTLWADGIEPGTDLPCGVRLRDT